MFVDPAAGPPEFVSVGLVLALPVPGELDVGEAGVEEPLPGVDEDAGALGLAVLDGLAGLGGQEGVAVALADALPFPLVLAFAEAFEVAVLMAVALAVPVAGAVAVVVSPGLVLPPPGPSLVPLSVALSDGLLTELAGVSLGVAEVVGLAGCRLGRGGRRRTGRARDRRRATLGGRSTAPGAAGRRADRSTGSVRALNPTAGAVTGDPDRGAELDEGLAQRGHRQRDADGEHGAGGRQGRAEQPVPPVPLLPRVTAALLRPPS